MAAASVAQLLVTARAISGVGFKPAPLAKQRYIADPLANLAAPAIGKCLYNSKLIVS